jgi:glycosyltransferase involved in cell wall biosynthesis
MSEPPNVIVVPCYNEARRLSPKAFTDYAARDGMARFLFVNDGSSDQTVELLRGLHSQDAERFRWISLEPNQGKAEAVRRGFLAALGQPAAAIGYWDADLSTPLEEIPRFVDVLRERPQVEIVLGARVVLLGRHVTRRKARHYLGRAAATFISHALGLPVYDTQCGAKLFRVTPRLAGVFAAPFTTRWLFDIEILFRYGQLTAAEGPGAREHLYELPLDRWTEVAGSKISAWSYLRALMDLARLRRRYPHWPCNP